MLKIILLLSYCLSISNVTATELILSDFSKNNALNTWQEKQFSGNTQYQLAQLDGELVLQAISQASASGLFKEQVIDLEQTPYLNWRWRIENRLSHLDEKTKAGDDYSARIYILISGGLAFWNTRAINYVWSSNLAVGEIWDNAFAGDHAKMWALRSVNDNLSTWQTEKRNIQADFKQLYGEDIRYIHGVAIMTDTDNSKGQAKAYYGNIYFSSQ